MKPRPEGSNSEALATSPCGSLVLTFSSGKSSLIGSTGEGIALV